MENLKLYVLNWVSNNKTLAVVAVVAFVLGAIIF